MSEAKKYDRSYKEQSVKLALEIGVKRASEELKVPYGTLYGWVQAVKNGDLDIEERTPENAMSLAEEIRHLRSEVKRLNNIVFVYIVFPHGLSRADMISQLRHQKTLSDFWRSHEKINARIEQTIYNRKLIFINGIIQFAQSHDVDIVGIGHSSRLNDEPCKCQ